MIHIVCRMQCSEGEHQYTSLQVSLPVVHTLAINQWFLHPFLFPTCSTPSCGSFHLQGHKWHISQKNRDGLVNLVVQLVEKIPNNPPGTYKTLWITRKNYQPQVVIPGFLLSWVAPEVTRCEQKVTMTQARDWMQNHFFTHKMGVLGWGKCMAKYATFFGFLSRKHQTKAKQIMHKFILLQTNQIMSK